LEVRKAEFISAVSAVAQTCLLHDDLQPRPTAVPAGSPPGSPTAARPKYNPDQPGARPIVGAGSVAKAGIRIELLRCGTRALPRCGITLRVSRRHQPATIADDQPDHRQPDLDVEVKSAVLGALVGVTERRKRARQRDAKHAPAANDKPQAIRLTQQGKPECERPEAFAQQPLEASPPLLLPPAQA